LILITGATGNLGQKLSDHLIQNTNYEIRRLDREARGEPDILEADLSEWAPAWASHFVGVDTVIHLAATANPFPSWQEMIRPNLDAVINVYTAAVQGGAKRIIFASSNHVLGGYRENGTDTSLHADTPPLPGMTEEGDPPLNTTPYGAFKLVGERLGKTYADIYGISFIGIRIGFIRRGENPAADNDNYETWLQQMWLSNRDYCQLMQKCIEADDSVKFAIINGVSNNQGMRWEIETARQLVGFVPEDGYDPA